MIVFVKSRLEMLTLKHVHPERIPHYNIISVCNYQGGYPDLVFREYSKSILTLAFDDLEAHELCETYIDPKELYYYRLFNTYMAREVIKFTSNIDSKPLIVHCEAGVSRSAAIAVWTQYFYGTLEDVQNLFLRYDYIKPNQLVLSTLLRVSGIENKRDVRFECFDPEKAKEFKAPDESDISTFTNKGGILVPKSKV